MRLPGRFCGLMSIQILNRSLPSWMGCTRMGDLRYWIEPFEAQAVTRDIDACTGQMSTGVEILLTMSHNGLTKAQEYIK